MQTETDAGNEEQLGHHSISTTSEAAIMLFSAGNSSYPSPARLLVLSLWGPQTTLTQLLNTRWLCDL